MVVKTSPQRGLRRKTLMKPGSMAGPLGGAEVEDRSQLESRKCRYKCWPGR